MGLDSHLHRRYMLSTGQYGLADERMLAKKVLEAVDERVLADLGTIHVDIPVAYWRKAQKIHDWFVRNVQDGEDDCQEYEVDSSHLRELIKACEEELADPGSTELTLDASQTGSNYEQWHANQLQATIDQLTAALASEREVGLVTYYLYRGWW